MSLPSEKLILMVLGAGFSFAALLALVMGLFLRSRRKEGKREPLFVVLLLYLFACLAAAMAGAALLFFAIA
jgi:hypothetical protein